jgi:hypothetical protein
VRPYIDGGLTFDTPAGLNETMARLVIPTRVTITTATSNPPELNNNRTTGVVVGLGLDVHARFLHFAGGSVYTLGFPALLAW